MNCRRRPLLPGVFRSAGGGSRRTVLTPDDSTLLVLPAGDGGPDPTPLTTDPARDPPYPPITIRGDCKIPLFNTQFLVFE